MKRTIRIYVYETIESLAFRSIFISVFPKNILQKNLSQQFKPFAFFHRIQKSSSFRHARQM